VLTGGAGARALTLAFRDLFGVASDLGALTLAGRTDSWIFRRMAEAQGFACDRTAEARFRELYVDHLREEIARPRPQKSVMPGVRDLLDALLERDEVCLALLTGNYAEGARIKLEHFDLWRYFPCGAFGDDAPDRNALLDKAMVVVAAREGRTFGPADTVVVGDTPFDVAVAAAGGARSLAVATGVYDASALAASGADAVLQDLSDTASVLAALGLD
jgi:phosphoglycolate phosphatase-like HAD superfamily hydrolase